TADSTTDQLQNRTLWSSYTEIIDVKQCYPNTAIVGLQVDAEQFGGQPLTVNYHIRGRIIQVPSNYDPEKRTYSGIWDGSLKPAYSNNPAWCLWDMLTHPRYGMGKRLGAADVDKWALYAIGQYCDQTVPDGFGGTEPRMTFNAYLSQQRKVWDVLGDFCSAMRCMPVWNGQTLTFVQDRPSDVVWPYTNSDVVVDDNGVGFRYSFSALKDRHTAVEVNYTDPQNGWQTSTELVEDPDAILRYGRNLLKMDAFGCTSRGQAHRAGLWVIKTELLETQTVDFTLGSQGLRHTPGDIIEICDNDYAGTLTGGRILSIDAASRTLTLDREVTLPETGTSTVNLINGSGKPVRVDITAHPAPDRIQVSVLPDGVATYGVWGLSLPSLRRRLFRCVSIRENTDGTFAITAVQHVPEKEAIVDNGARFEPLSGSLNSVIPPAVQHLTVEVSASDGQYLALAKWDTPRVVKGVRFSLRLTSGSGENSRLVTTAITADTEHRFSGLPLGEYTLTVRAINSYGQQGEPATTAFRINAPAAPASIELTPGYYQITAVPVLAVYDPTVQYEFWFSEKRITDTAQVEISARYLGTGSQWSVSGPHIKPGRDFWFYVRSVNLVGKSAFVEASGRASNDAEGYLDFFRGEIGKTHLAQGMWELIDNSQLDDEMAEMKTTITETRNEITQTVSKTLEDQSATIQQIQRVQTDTNNDLAALYMLKVQKTKNGIPYVAGIGAGIEDADGQPLSNILLQADRIAMINPENGNTTPLFVAQGNQLFMNDVFLKRLFAVSITSSGNPPTFSLTPEGRLTARNADISGHISANSGTLNNVVIAENCTINGTLKAENIIGDLVKCAGVAFPVDGSHLANGTRTLTVYDDHSFDRQIIIPPIIYVGSKQESRTSNDIWTECFLHVDQNGRRIYSGRSVTEPGIFSGIIDMPAGGGHITLSFTVSSRRQNNSWGSSRISNLQAIVVKKNSAGISIR
ncbi:host specificity protein J, partial [Escherichia coli]|nr:host specificity protein J [Escherichia coli]EHH4863494.1 host specificity protein J [Escherichia coli]EHY4117684.1 host specificity protein J [Escherichia coli]EJK7810012.1 host specificity protein J [Escherichia coli]EJK7858752.1 host specificity protein J [Escherichia coli]